jgi:hypothetical protein
VYGTIAYYLANQAEVDSYLVRQSRKWEDERRSAEKRRLKGGGSQDWLPHIRA